MLESCLGGASTAVVIRQTRVFGRRAIFIEAELDRRELACLIGGRLPVHDCSHQEVRGAAERLSGTGRVSVYNMKFNCMRMALYGHSAKQNTGKRRPVEDQGPCRRKSSPSNNADTARHSSRRNTVPLVAFGLGQRTLNTQQVGNSAVRKYTHRARGQVGNGAAI